MYLENQLLMGADKKKNSPIDTLLPSSAKLHLTNKHSFGVHPKAILSFSMRSWYVCSELVLDQLMWE